MTNTKTQEAGRARKVAEVITADIDTERCYTWDKSWVRPYESTLSVYINFCKINVLTYHDLRRIWQSKNYTSCNARFYSMIHCPAYADSEFVVKLTELLIPSDHYFFPDIKGDIPYRSTFHYCPECIKQGYHSLLSQIPSETDCPIHDVPYIDLNRYMSIGMRGEYTIFEDMLSMELPLPQEREPLDCSKIEERVKEVISGAVSLGYSLPYSNDYYPVPKLKELYSRGSRELVSVIDGTLSYQENIDKVRNHFCNIVLQTMDLDSVLNGAYYESMEKYLEDFWEYSFLGCDYNIRDYLYRAEIMACMLEYVKDVDRDRWPGSFPYIEKVDFSTYSSEDEVMTKASYCYAVRGNEWGVDIFSFRYLFILGGCETRNVRYTYTTQLDHLDSNVHKAISAMSPVGKLDIRELCSVAVVEVVRDQFWAQAERYEAHIKNRESFNFWEEWRNIQPLAYEFHQNEDGTLYIYRISG